MQIFLKDIICLSQYRIFTFNFFLLQKALGWDGGQTGGNPGAPQSGGTQGAQGFVHWMSVMAEHMDPAVSHYMSWNQEVSLTCLEYFPFRVIWCSFPISTMK